MHPSPEASHSWSAILAQEQQRWFFFLVGCQKWKKITDYSLVGGGFIGPSFGTYTDLAQNSKCLTFFSSNMVLVQYYALWSSKTISKDTGWYCWRTNSCISWDGNSGLHSQTISKLSINQVWFFPHIIKSGVPFFSKDDSVVRFNPFEKYARQNGNLPQGSGWKFQIFELPPPSDSNSGNKLDLPPPRISVANEGLGWDSLLKM